MSLKSICTVVIGIVIVGLFIGWLTSLYGFWQNGNVELIETRAQKEGWM